MIPETSRKRRKLRVLSRKTRLIAWAGLFVAVFLVGMIAGGSLTQKVSQPTQIKQLQAALQTLQQQINFVETERDQLMAEKVMADNNIDWFTREVGKLQAHIIQIEALGTRLTELANLDESEFNFGAEIALGGPLVSGPEEDTVHHVVHHAVKLANAIQAVPPPLADHAFQAFPDDTLDNKLVLANLNNQVRLYSSQLRYIESFLIQNQINGNNSLSGWPIKSGWLSSRFGARVDPFTGKRAFHNGIDLAGKKGTEIYAAADGIVTWSGKLSAYGLMVEIDHGKGYHTRYAHAHKLLVQSGARVKKGQLIALMGSTGRSTGNHLHFEVRCDGKAEDPLKYMRSKS